MGKLADFLDAVNLLTGRTRRHNRALRDVMDLAEAIQEFFSRYHLQDKSPDFDFLFENIGTAKIELTTIAYQLRTTIKTAKNVKGKKLSPLFEQAHSDLEEVRRALIKPALGTTPPGEGLANLHESLKKLNDAISGIEYK